MPPLSNTGPNASARTKASIILEAAASLTPKLNHLTSRDMLIQHLAETAGDRAAQFTIRDAFEMLECAVVAHMLQAGEGAGQNLVPLTQTYLGLPTHTVRSEIQVSRQQFSSPAPLALFAQSRASLAVDDLMLEPSAGTGLLATETARLDAALHLNELDPHRRALVSGLFPRATVTGFDGAEIAARWQGRAPTVVLMNPPFSRNADGYEDNFTALRHLHSALKALRPGGRLVAILPSWIDRAGRNAAGLAKMIAGASIVERFALAEGCFAKQGTSVATTLLVIDKMPGLPLVHNLPVATLAELGEQPEALPRQALSQREDVSPPARSVFGGFVRKLAPAPIIPARSAPDMAIAPIAYAVLDEPAVLGEQVGDYLPYRPARLIFEDAGEHPTALVESLAMGSVAPPRPYYSPILPARVVKERILSSAQLETLVYAGQAHSEWLTGDSDEDPDLPDIPQPVRKGYFLGDGTGAGKGRQIAAVILDNWLRGRRRHIWVSKNATLLEDARRDWTAVGGLAADIQPLSNWSMGKQIAMAEGVLFVPYATLRSQREEDSRLEQILAWAEADAGAAFEGVIAFDEAHAMGGVAGGENGRGQTKGSEQGIAGVTLQDRLPAARVLYASATGASNVSNLAYAVRLGLWGPETAFATRELFITEIAAGGIAAMEVVARDLKSMGLYTARALSFGGIEYEMLEHILSVEQIAIYDRYAEAWSLIHQNMEAALEEAGVIDTVSGDTLNAGAKAAARSRFESVKQRFFQQLLMSMKLPSLFPAMTAHLADGMACVIQLVSTGEAMLDRRLADLDEEDCDELDIDLSPREYLFDYLSRAFPTRQMEVYLDVEGETGRSYHASLDVPNQRRRVHFLLEPGWRADAAIQGLGRTHRTHQACPPLFRPVTTDCRGERRFISTIARRLDSLGALTRGQRQTGGQNLFDPADNLESDYAKSALEAWFRLLHRGKLNSASFDDFQKRTGLELEGEGGELRMELPPIQRWLNRILALPIAMQNAVFDEFLGLVEQRVDRARQAGTGIAQPAGDVAGWGRGQIGAVDSSGPSVSIARS